MSRSTSRDWQPGDVAIGTVDGRPNVRVVAGWSKYDPQLRWCEISPRWADGDDDSCWFMPSQVTDLRRLVAIELPDGALAGWPVLINALRRALDATGLHMVFGGLIEQIQQQTEPSKPDEPKGLGAVVRVPSRLGADFGMRLLVRAHATHQPWLGDGIKQDWDEIEGPVEVLSEGVLA